MKSPDQVVYRPLGRDQTADLRILAECISASDANLFSQGNGVVLVNAAGELVLVNPTVLSEIIKTHVVTKVPVNRAGKWQIEFRPVELDEMALRTMLREEVGLGARLPRWPSAPVRLSDQQKREVVIRLREGEPAESVGRSYGIGAEMVRALGRAG